MVRLAESGYVALLAVLIVGAAATAIALVLVGTGANSQRSALVSQQAKQARALAVSCGHEALQQIHDNPAYSGTGALPLGQGNCTYTVVITGPVTRSVAVRSTVGNAVKNIQAYATIGTTSIGMTSWQEVI